MVLGGLAPAARRALQRGYAASSSSTALPSVSAGVAPGFSQQKRFVASSGKTEKFNYERLITEDAFVDYTPWIKDEELSSKLQVVHGGLDVGLPQTPGRTWGT